MAKSPDEKCLKVAEVADDRFGEGKRRTVICRKSEAHKTSERPDRRRHYDPAAKIYWTDDEAL